MYDKTLGILSGKVKKICIRKVWVDVRYISDKINGKSVKCKFLILIPSKMTNQLNKM